MEFPRALGKFYALVRAHLFSFIDDAKVQHSRCGLRIICGEFLLFFCAVVKVVMVILVKIENRCSKYNQYNINIYIYIILSITDEFPN